MFGVKFQLFTDHKNLKHLYNKKDLNMSQRWWIEFLNDYDVDLDYHSGKANVIANALSRKTFHDEEDKVEMKRKKLGILNV